MTGVYLINYYGLYFFFMQAGIIEEVVNDAVDTALDSEDIEEEIEEEVDKVLTAIAGETAAQLPEAVRKEKMKQPAQRVGTSEEVCGLISLVIGLFPLKLFYLRVKLIMKYINFVGRGYS